MLPIASVMINGFDAEADDQPTRNGPAERADREPDEDRRHDRPALIHVEPADENRDHPVELGDRKVEIAVGERDQQRHHEHHRGRVEAEDAGEVRPLEERVGSRDAEAGDDQHESERQQRRLAVRALKDPGACRASPGSPS